MTLLQYHGLPLGDRNDSAAVPRPCTRRQQGLDTAAAPLGGRKVHVCGQASRDLAGPHVGGPLLTRACLLCRVRPL